MQLNQSTGDQLFCINMSIVALNHDEKDFASKPKRSIGITKLLQNKLIAI